MPDIKNLLSPDETIVWQGRPNRKAFILSNLIPLVLFAYPFFIGNVLWVLLSVKINMWWIMIPMGLPTLIFSYIIAVYGTYLLFTDKIYPIYYITSKKRGFIISEKGGFTSIFKSYVAVFSYSNVTSTAVTQGYVASLVDQNLKSIRFGLGVSDRLPSYTQTANIPLNATKEEKDALLRKAYTESEHATASFVINGKSISFAYIDNAEDVLKKFKESENASTTNLQTS